MAVGVLGEEAEVLVPVRPLQLVDRGFWARLAALDEIVRNMPNRINGRPM